jgi:hypothetical protein
MSLTEMDPPHSVTTTLVYTVPVHVVIDDQNEVILSVTTSPPLPTEIDHALDSGENVLDPDVDYARIDLAVRVAAGLDWPDWEVVPS